MTREQFRTALAGCGCTLRDGNVYYEEDDLIECLEDMKLFDSVELEPCEDCISRQSAINRFDLVQSDDLRMSYDDIMAFLSSLPSVEPERKPGKWVDGKCNRCGTHAPFWEMATTYYCSEYCPKCGAKMEVEK